MSALKLNPENSLCQETKKHTFSVGNEHAGKRLDMFLKDRFPDISRSQIQKWVHRGGATLDGRPAEAGTKLKEGQTLVLEVRAEAGVEPEDIPIQVLYEDKHFLAVNKPAGMLTHPAPGQHIGTLVNAVAWHLKGQKGDSKALREFLGDGETLRPGVVHRLDKDTSGVILVAKDLLTLEKLSHQFREREVQKTYRTIVEGQMKVERGEVEGSIGKGYRSAKMMVTAAGRFSKTDFKVLKAYPNFTYLEVYPKTGRTHQIRVHLAKIGHPVLGDKVYGPPMPGLANVGRQMLHAYKIAVQHPKTNKRVEFTAPLPEDFEETLKRIAKSSGSTAK